MEFKEHLLFQPTHQNITKFYKNLSNHERNFSNLCVIQLHMICNNRIIYTYFFIFAITFVLFSTRRNGKQGQIRAANNIKTQNVTQCTIVPLPSAYPRSLQTWYWPLLYCAEVYSRPCQTSKTELLAKINNGFSLKKYLKANFWAVNSFYSSDLLFFF